jgi:hypothetical protein
MNDNFAKEIIPKDDAFHGSPKRIAAEWWYFDAVLNDGISIHIGFKTFSKRNKGFISPLIEIYRDGKIEHESSKRVFLRRSKISMDVPSVVVFDEPMMTFDMNRYEKKNEWSYHVKMKIEDLSVDLDFLGLTQGWKIETPVESWTVALPKAKVTGTIGIKGKIIDVQGVGYHDHNWNYSLLTAMNYGKGWYWGKITSETMTITWANIIKSSKKSVILSVVNQDGKGFMNINPTAISFKPDEYIWNHRKKIPTQFSFQINDFIESDKITTNVIMNVKELHFNRILFLPYWRYHTQAKGSIMVGNVTEKINDIQIMEYLKLDVI